MTSAPAVRPGLTRRMLLRRSAAVSVAGPLVGGLPAGAALPSTAPRPALRRPNVVVISFDDLSWNDFGCYGNTFHETPHIDRLASRGMRFTQAYAAAPVCSPTRAALMTGLYPARTGITNFLGDGSSPGDHHLPLRFRTVPEQVAGRGYRSALIGKWHLTDDYSGPYRSRKGNPYAHGFDSVLLSEEKYIAWGDMFFPYRFMPSVRGRQGEYLTDRIATDTARWIERHAAAPFFMHVSNYAVHYKWAARVGLVRKYKRKKRRHPEFRSERYNPVVAAMIERCDHQVGRIVRQLRDSGIAENTLILITSDNGGGRRSNAPLRGGKGSLHEGGIRVPLVACWPGTVPPGTKTDSVVSTIDILPTIRDLAGAGGASGLDGVSLADLLVRQEPLAPRSTFWYYPHHLGGAGPSAAVRSGRYKLVKRLRTGTIELYDIDEDRRERRNLARRKPRVARLLHRKLRRHIAEMRRVPDRPTARNFPVLVAQAAAPRDGDHGVLRLGGSPRTQRSKAGLVVSATDPGRVLLRSRHAPTGDPGAIVIDPGLAPRQSADPSAPSEGLQVSVGLAKDERNHLSVTYDHDRRTVGWALVSDGVDLSTAGEPEDLSALAGTVDLSAPGARLGMSVAGSTVGVYVDQADGWEFLFLVDVGGVMDLTDPRVRRQWRFAVGVGLASGEHAVGGYEVRRRPVK